MKKYRFVALVWALLISGIFLSANAKEFDGLKSEDYYLSKEKTKHYMTALEFYNDCKDSLNNSSNDLNLFARSFCAVQIQGVINSFAIASIPSAESNKNSNCNKCNAAFYRKFCPPVKNLSPFVLLEQRVAQDFISWFESYIKEDGHEKTMRSPSGGVIALFYNGRYQCKN